MRTHLAFAAMALCGCQSILGIDDPILDPGAGGDPDGGQQDGQQNNRPPEITGISIGAGDPDDPVLISQIVGVQCLADDPDGDDLTFLITTDLGTIDDPDLAQVNWTPEGREGAATITCVVEDGNGGTDTADLTAQVIVDPLRLVTQLSFDGTLADSSGNGNDATFFGNEEFTTDRFNNPVGALRFPGLDPGTGEGRGALQPESEYDLTELTIALWIRLDATSSADQIVLTKTADPSSGGNFTYVVIRDVGADRNKLRYSHDDNASNVSLVASNEALPFGTYVHAAVVVSPGEVRAYVDGVLAQTADSGVPAQNNFSPLLGAGLDAGGFPFGGFTGAMDDLRIYGRALSDDEVAAIANGDPP